MLQRASTVFPGIIESNQYFPLTACRPSLALISLHVSAGSLGMEPRGTGNQTSLLVSFQDSVEAPVSGHLREAEKVRVRKLSWPLTGMCKNRVCMS